MDCIRNYSVLYDKGNKDYKDQRIKKNAQLRVKTKLGIDIIEAQTRYKNIRTGFSKYIKRLRRTSGAGRNDIPKIRQDYEYLRWLIKHIKHRDSITNLNQNRTRDNSLNEENFTELDSSCDTLQDCEEILDVDNRTAEPKQLSTASDLLVSEQHNKGSTASTESEYFNAMITDDVESQSGLETESVSNSASKKCVPQLIFTPERKRAWASKSRKKTAIDIDAEFFQDNAFNK